MDNFIEQIVSKRKTTSDRVKAALIIVFGSLLVAVLAFFAILTGFMVLMLIGAGVIYFMWIFLSGMTVEYEYIITNNEIDVDKIQGRRKRKRLVTLKLNKAEGFDLYNENDIPQADVTVAAHNCSGEFVWYVLAPHDKHGKVMLLFSPNDRVLMAVNKAVPYALKKREITKKTRELESAEEIERQKAIDSVLHPFDSQDDIDNGEIGEDVNEPAE